MKVTNLIGQNCVNTAKASKPLKKLNVEVAETVKRVFPYAAGAASVVLANFAINNNNEKIEEPSIDDDFLEVLSQDLAAHKYMHKEDVYYLAQNFESAPAFVADLIMQKDEKGNLRMLRRELAEAVFEAYQINPKLTENLISEMNEKGEFKYDLNEIRSLVNISANMPKALKIATEDPIRVEKLLMQEDEVGKKTYSVSDIEDLFKMEKEEPELSKFLLEMQECTEPRFSIKQVKYILAERKKYPEFVDSLVNEKVPRSNQYKLNAAAIIDLLKLANEDNIKIINTLRNCKYAKEDNDKVTYEEFELTTSEIINLLKNKKISDYAVLFYCENFYSNRDKGARAKKIIETMGIKNISPETYNNLKEYKKEYTTESGWIYHVDRVDRDYLKMIKNLMETDFNK